MPLLPLQAAAAPPLEVSLAAGPAARLSWEGKGFRETLRGWESKTKSQTPLFDLSLRKNLGQGAVTGRFLANVARFEEETGQADGHGGIQINQTKLQAYYWSMDYRRSVAGLPFEAVAGLQAVYQVFDRKDFILDGAPAAGEAREELFAPGILFGLHGRALQGSAERPTRWYLDWEMLLGHLLASVNRQEASRGSISSGGFTYQARAELGRRFGRSRLGLGLMFQALNVQVPGGRALPSGVIVSHVENRLTLMSQFLAWSVDF